MPARTDIQSILVIGAGPIVIGQPGSSVQYHPEASPGPMDSFHLFEKFVGMSK